MIISSYKLNKKSNFKKYNDIDLDSSYAIKRKKEKSMGIIRIFNSELKDVAIKKGINSHFKKLLELIVSTSEDGDNADGLMLCLDEIQKFRNEINNKYNSFLKKKEKEVALKKLEVIERELKEKLVMYQLCYDNLYNKNDDVKEEIHHLK